MAKTPAPKQTPNYRNSDSGQFTTKKQAEAKPKEHEKEKRQ